ncbi:MAG: hypothetical protein D6732_12800 [Methanobacteriota archaeon]|nr:MAG: hypothetical protein D6732_12800 [Euryarchaeota archaeon]
MDKQAPITRSDIHSAFEETLQANKEKMIKEKCIMIDINIRHRRYMIELVDNCPTFLITEWHLKEGNWYKEFGYYAYNSAIAIELLFTLIRTSMEEEEDLKSSWNKIKEERAK